MVLILKNFVKTMFLFEKSTTPVCEQMMMCANKMTALTNKQHTAASLTNLSSFHVINYKIIPRCLH